jgi:hypothetical protein
VRDVGGRWPRVGRWLGGVGLAGGLAAAALAVALGLGGPAPPAGAAGEQIVVSTDPPLGQIHPHGGPSAGIGPDTLIVEVKDGAGRPVPNVLLDVQMDAPPTNWFISTDVPRIEGRPLLNWSAVAPEGRQEFAYIFPIRGDYHLTVKASPAPGAPPGFTPVSRDLTVSISEKPMSLVYLGLFLGALFLFGAISGVVLGRANWAARRPA